MAEQLNSDVWTPGDLLERLERGDSQEAFDRFANDRLLPALKKLVGEQAPQIQPMFGQLHNELHR